jgi:group II intron reverse transcriptase/maturase
LELQEGKMNERLSSENVSTRLQQVAELAKQAPNMVLTTLAHHIDIDFLKEAYRRTRKDGAPGVDGQTAADYAKDLDTNLESLLSRFKSGTYKAPPVRRTYIPKGDGTDRQRALGIPTFEDKVLQRAVTMVLEAVYEQEFYDFSYAYRPRRTQHQALQSVWEALMGIGGGWLLEIDIQDCFGSLGHQHLRGCLDRRVRDGVIRKAIDKWLSAGIMEKGEIEYPEEGCPQGGVVSPIVSNIYLHEVMDTWFDNEVRPRMRGKVHMVRWADDIILIFEEEIDARRVQEVLPKRFGKYGLTLHPTKTRLTEFRRPKRTDRRGKGNFDFLGFAHYWGKSRQGNWVVKRKTASKRFQSRVRAVAEWCRSNRHETIRDQHQTLVRKLRGHYQYYGITGNFRCLANFLFLVRRAWFKWLCRRAQRKTLTWNRFVRILEHLPLPQPRIAHSYLCASPTP